MIQNNTVFDLIAQHKNNNHSIEPAYYNKAFRTTHTQEFPHTRNRFPEIVNNPGSRIVIQCNDCNEALHVIEPEQYTTTNTPIAIQSDTIFTDIERHVTDNHHIQLQYYTNNNGTIINIALVCNDCNQVLHDIERQQSD